MRKFKELKVWNLGIELVELVYSITSDFPVEEKYNLISQMRRSSVSIPSNIAEGCSKSTSKALQHYIEIALGSSFELETQLYLANKLQLMEPNDELNEKLQHLQASLNSFRSKLR